MLSQAFFHLFFFPRFHFMSMSQKVTWLVALGCLTHEAQARRRPLPCRRFPTAVARTTRRTLSIAASARLVRSVAWRTWLVSRVWPDPTKRTLCQTVGFSIKPTKGETFCSGRKSNPQKGPVFLTHMTPQSMIHREALTGQHRLKLGFGVAQARRGGRADCC